MKQTPLHSLKHDLIAFSLQQCYQTALQNKYQSLLFSLFSQQLPTTIKFEMWLIQSTLIIYYNRFQYVSGKRIGSIDNKTRGKHHTFLLNFNKPNHDIIWQPLFLVLKGLTLCLHVNNKLGPARHWQAWPNDERRDTLHLRWLGGRGVSGFCQVSQPLHDMWSLLTHHTGGRVWLQNLAD